MSRKANSLRFLAFVVKAMTIVVASASRSFCFFFSSHFPYRFFYNSFLFYVYIRTIFFSFTYYIYFIVFNYFITFS